MAASQELLLGMIQDALGQLADYPASQQGVQAPLPSLLAQCENFLARAGTAEPVRTLHHLACSGGTVISKCLALMPNTVLLSEIDPLSQMLENRAQPKFAPTDLIHGLRHALRGIDETVIARVFVDSVVTLRDQLARRGQVLVLRDHPHSHFFTARRPDSRPTLREILAPEMPVLPLVTIRHPADSYMSLERNRWHLHFRPSTLDEYARRSLLFLRRYGDVERIRYEDFTTDPEAMLQQMCHLLQLDYVPDTPKLLRAVSLSGDSGRRGDVIAPRPPRPLSGELASACAASKAYEELCALLDYDPTRIS